MKNFTYVPHLINAFRNIKRPRNGLHILATTMINYDIDSIENLCLIIKENSDQSGKNEAIARICQITGTEIHQEKYLDVVKELGLPTEHNDVQKRVFEQILQDTRLQQRKGVYKKELKTKSY